MDLSTKYMGFTLKNPIIVSSSKLTSNIDDIRKCADYGAGAIVLRSLFEEQFIADSNRLIDQDHKYFWYPEAIEFINTHSKEHGVKGYLKLIEEAKKHTYVPIIASINCVTPSEWPRFARSLVDAGADGLELNMYLTPPNEFASSKDLEDRYTEIVEEVKRNVHVPVSAKLAVFFTNILRVVMSLNQSGVDAVVLFNRFFRPDIDIDTETVVKPNFISTPEELGQPLRWVSLFSKRVNCDIAGNTGIHDATGMIKMLLAGANAVQICSTLYKNGIGYIDTMLFDLEKWMKTKNYESINDFRGKITKYHDNVAAFERVQFIKLSMSE